jgi:hypothetical protein
MNIADSYLYFLNNIESNVNKKYLMEIYNQMINGSYMHNFSLSNELNEYNYTKYLKEELKPYFDEFVKVYYPVDLISEEFKNKIMDICIKYDEVLEKLDSIVDNKSLTKNEIISQFEDNTKILATYKNSIEKILFESKEEELTSLLLFNFSPYIDKTIITCCKDELESGGLLYTGIDIIKSKIKKIMIPIYGTFNYTNIELSELLDIQKKNEYIDSQFNKIKWFTYSYIMKYQDELKIKNIEFDKKLELICNKLETKVSFEEFNEKFNEKFNKIDNLKIELMNIVYEKLNINNDFSDSFTEKIFNIEFNKIIEKIIEENVNDPDINIEKISSSLKLVLTEIQKYKYIDNSAVQENRI